MEFFLKLSGMIDAPVSYEFNSLEYDIQDLFWCEKICNTRKTEESLREKQQDITTNCRSGAASMKSP